MNCAMLNPPLPPPPPPFSNQSSNSASNRELYHDYRSLQPVTPGHDPAMTSQQFAYPIRGQMAYPSIAIPRSGTAFNEEHMLRRKTPSGTINGAYESNAHDMQASKHMLIPRNDTPQAFTQFTQLDSVLHQTPYRQVQPHQFYGQTVPSVLQPPYQYLGPTASGIEARGPYGPYWNDGTYVPYRPAALRDPRNYSADQSDLRWASNGGVGYGRMSSWQNDASAPTPLNYPSSGTRNVSWPMLTHGGLALPHPYAMQGSTGLLQGKKKRTVILLS